MNRFTQLPQTMPLGHAELMIAEPLANELIVAAHPGQALFLNVGDSFTYYHEPTADGFAYFNLMHPLPANAKIQVWCDTTPAHLTRLNP